MKYGIAETVKIADLAKQASRKLMIGCMLEPARSIAVSAAIAIGRGDFDFIDLDSHLLLVDPTAAIFIHQSGHEIMLRGNLTENIQ